jgi:hypothetical protein
MDGIAFARRFPPLMTLGPLHAACLYRREVALPLDFYRMDILSSDFESFYRLMAHGRVAFVDSVAAFWRQHGGNASADPPAARQIANLAVIDGPAAHYVAEGAMAPEEAAVWASGCRAGLLLSALARTVAGQGGRAASLAVARHLLVREPTLALRLPRAILRRLSQRPH